MDINPHDAEELITMTNKVIKATKDIKFNIVTQQIDLRKLIDDNTNIYPCLNELFSDADKLSTNARKLQQLAELYKEEAPW